MTLPWRCALLLLALLLPGKPAHGYLVGPGLPLDEIIEQSDVIFKGTALSSTPGKSKGFDSIGGFEVLETQFKVISVLKGICGDNLKFRHYGAGGPGISMFSPQCYDFEAGRTYLICAKRTDDVGVYQQLWTYPTMTDESVVRCTNNQPVTAKTFKEALCSELVDRLHGSDNQDLLRVIGRLDQLGGGFGYGATLDFDRKAVLAGVHGLMTNPDPKVAQAALQVVGGYSPFLSDEQTIYWLNTVGSVKWPNVGTIDPQKKNIGGDLYRSELVAVAEGKSDADARATAIASLGLVRDPAFARPLEHWLSDPSPVVRRSATLLLSDFPELATPQQLALLAKDTAPEVRTAAALTMGMLQEPKNADLLAKLLDDPDIKVRTATVTSLVTFSPKDKNIAAIFRANVDRSEFAPIFFNALALDDPTAHLDSLAKVVSHNTEPDNPWIGETPHILAWEILLNYLQAQSAEQLKSGKFDTLLDALGKVSFSAERMDVSRTRGLLPYEAPGLDVIENESNIYNISVPAIVYAFYLQHGMTDRAKKYHAWSKTNSPDFAGDLDILFKIVDENPAIYVRSSKVVPSPAPGSKLPTPMPLDTSPLFVPP